MERRQAGDQIHGGQRSDLADVQDAAHLATDGGNVIAQMPQRGEHLACMRQECFTGGRYPDLARQPLEQRGLQFVLEMGDLVAQR